VTPAEFILARLDERERSLDCPEFVEDTASVRGPGWGSVGGCPLCGVRMWDGYEDSVKVGWRACVVDQEDRSVVYPDAGQCSPSDADHIARHDPARVLREVAALRAVVEIHEPVKSAFPSFTAPMVCGVCSPGKEEGWDAPCPTLRHLASIWSDHEDYDPAWQPVP
jgi:hypothetical protein